MFDDFFKTITDDPRALHDGQNISNIIQKLYALWRRHFKEYQLLSARKTYTASR